MQGKVKWYSPHMGYGFIVNEEGKDIFVHKTFLNEDEELFDGEKVEFDVVEEEAGTQARNVVKID